jgi:hypothetical protein
MSIVTTHDTAEPDWQHWAKRIHGSWQKAVESIIETGKLLLEAKADLPHGEFTNMINERLPFGPRTAEMLMKVAEHPVISDPNQWFAFPPSWRTLSELALLPPKIVKERIADHTINPEMRRIDVARLKPGLHRDPAAKHRAKMTPIARLKEEKEELERENADLEEKLAGAQAQDGEWEDIWDNHPEKILDYIIIVAGEDKAKEIVACGVKRFKEAKGRRPAKAKQQAAE